MVDEQIDVFNRESGGTITLPIVSIPAIESGFTTALGPRALVGPGYLELNACGGVVSLPETCTASPEQGKRLC